MRFMLSTPAGSLRQLREQLQAMRTLVAMGEEKLTATKPLSQWSTSEHLDHITRVSLAMLQIILAPNPKPQPKSINLIGRVILAIGRIPRGRSRAPERFRAVRVPAATLTAILDQIEQSAAQVDPKTVRGQRTATVWHPVFGGLTPAQALRFMIIHNEHHLRIVREILTR